MEKKLMLIINPAAGKGSYKVNLGEALHVLDMGGYRTSLFFTAGRGDATDFARAYAKEFDTVACIGGDGTLSEVISGLMELDSPPPLGYIPMGTANDVATTLNLPKNDTVAAARRIVHGSAHPFDVGGFGDNAYFAYIAAFGAFTEVSYKTDQELKRTLGHLAYVLGGLNALSTIKSYKTVIEHEGGVIEGDFIYGAMSNSLSVAGMVRLNDELVDLSDGKFEVLLVRRPKDVAEINSILTGVLNKTYESPCLTVVQSSFVKFTFDQPVPWTRDGEDGGTHRELCLRSHHHAVDIYC